MNFSFIPDIKLRKISDITPELLHEKGISLLLMDLDNTVSPYKTDEPTEEIMRWVKTMEDGGIRLFFVSNNKGDRPAVFSEKMGIPYVKLAKKPSRRGIITAMERENYTKSDTALVGDQIYTDVLAANRAGITSILVEPIKFTNPLLAIRYFFELPFRHQKRKKR